MKNLTKKERREDEKDDVSAGALGLDLNRWSSVPIIAVASPVCRCPC
jgi:hypothetical protein